MILFIQKHWFWAMFLAGLIMAFMAFISWAIILFLSVGFWLMGA